MPDRTLFEIVSDIKKNLNNEVALKLVLDELEEWKRIHQKDLSSLPKTKPAPMQLGMPTFQAQIPISGKKVPAKKGSGNIDATLDFNALTQASTEAEMDLRLITDEVSQTCISIEKKSENILEEFAGKFNQWQQQIQELEILKSKLRISPEHPTLAIEIEERGKPLQREYEVFNLEVKDQLQHVKKTINYLDEKINAMTEHLPPRIKILERARLEDRMRSHIQSVFLPELNLLQQKLECYAHVYLSDRGNKIRTVLLDSMAFDELEKLVKDQSVHEDIQRQIEGFIKDGKPVFWPEYFEQGIDVNLDSLKSSPKKAYLDKDVVQPFKNTVRLTSKGKKELVQEWINEIPVVVTGTDEQLYLSLKAALALSLSEQPLNLEKIQGHDQKSGNAVPFFKLKDPSEIGSVEAIDSDAAFTRARLAADYLRETYSSTILAQFDALHQHIVRLQDPSLSPLLKAESQQSIEKTMMQFKGTLFRLRGRAVPDENLLDIFKVMLAPRKVSAKEESIPGITPLLAELNIQFYDPIIAELISVTKLEYRALNIELQSLTAEYNALETRALQASSSTELEQIAQGKLVLEKLIDDKRMAIEALTKRIFKSLPKQLKIEPQKSVIELEKKPEFRGLKTTLLDKSQEREKLNNQISELQIEKAKLERDLEDIAVYEADSIIQELTLVSEKLEKCELEASKAFSIEPQHLPLTSLTTKYQADIQGFYLNSVFAAPTVKVAEIKKSDDMESVRDYRGIYYQIDKSKPAVAIETLYQGDASDPEEVKKALAQIMAQGTNDVPALVKPEDFSKLQIDLDFLSWEEKKALAAFLTPASFKLSLNNFIELQNQISKVLIGGMSSKVEMKDLLEIASGIKFRRPGKNLAPMADVPEAFYAKAEEYFSTKDLITAAQNIELNTRMIETAKMATHSQDIPAPLHNAFLTALPADIKIPILNQMITEKVPLDNFDTQMLMDSEYKSLFSSMFEFLLQEQISKPSTTKYDRPAFLKKPLAVDNDTEQNLSLKFITYFEARGSSQRQALTSLVDYYFDCIRDDKINKDQLVKFARENLDKEDVAQICAKRLFPVSQLIERISLIHSNIIPETVEKLNDTNQEERDKILNNNNVIQHLTSTSQRTVVNILLKSGDVNAKQFLAESFPEAKLKFTKNLKVSQGILSAMALAPFLSGDIARNAEKYFNLKGPTLDRFNDIIETHLAANTQKINKHYSKRMIENAFLNPEYLAKLVAMLKEVDSSAILNIDIQEFDAFQEELSRRLSSFLDINQEKGVNEIFSKLDFDKIEIEAIRREVAEFEEEFLKTINLDLAKFLVGAASPDALSDFLEGLTHEQQNQFVLDNMGPKPLLMQLNPNDLMLLVNAHYNEIATSIDPENAIKRRDIYLRENKDKQQRQKRLQEASEKAKEAIEKQKVELANKRLAEDRARLLAATNFNLDQDILRELDQLGFNKADPDTIKLLRDIRALKTSLNTIPLLDVSTQIQEMNTQIFPGLKNLQVEITKLLAVIESNINVDQRQIDQGVMTIVTKELAEANHLFLSKGQELGSVAINISGLQDENAQLRANVDQAKDDSILEIMQLRRDLEDAKRQLEKEKQKAASSIGPSSSGVGSIQEETRKRIQAEEQLKEVQELLSKASGVGPPQGPVDVLTAQKPLAEALEAFYNQEEYKSPGVHRSPDRKEVIQWLQAAYSAKYTKFVPQVDSALSAYKLKHKL